jgi:hypothetical protein
LQDAGIVPFVVALKNAQVGITIAANAVTSTELQFEAARQGSTTAEMAAVFAQWHAVSSYAQLSALRARVWHDRAQEGMTLRISVMVKHGGGTKVAFEGIVLLDGIESVEFVIAEDVELM